VQFGVATHPSLSRKAPNHFNPFGNSTGRFSCATEKVTGLRAIHVDHEVDAVEQWPGNPAGITGPGMGRTAAPDLPSDTAGARVHGGDQQHSGGLLGGSTGPGNPYDSFLEWLTERVQHRRCKLAEFVEEKHAVRSGADFARSCTARASADESGHGCGMMRCPKRRLPDESVREGQARRTVDTRDLHRLIGIEDGKQARKAPGQHRLSGPRRPDEQQMVPAGGSVLERKASSRLAADVGHVGTLGYRRCNR